MPMLPEEKARVKIDKQLRNAGWDIVARNEYLPNSTSAVKEALMGGNAESDYLLFIDGKAIAVVEAKREENPLGDEVKKQAEDYAVSPQAWYGLWFEKLIPLVYMANGNNIYFKNMLVEDSDYEELSQMHSPKKMLQIVGKKSEYEENVLFGRHLDYFITNFGFAPRKLANDINTAFTQGTLVEYISPSHDNSMRMGLIYCLIGNLQARNKLLEMQRGYLVENGDDDKVLYAGFSKESAKTYIENFEKYLEDHKDDIEALRIIYNSEDKVITHDMLMELRDRLLSESRQYGVYQIWKNYKLLDEQGDVEALDGKANVNALTNLIQIVRYAYKKSQKLTSLINGYASRFSLYCGQNQRILTEEQKDIMQQIAEYIINDGAITVMELNETDTELWKKAVKSFGGKTLASEIQTLSKFILKVA